jgi:hypothetical protein
MLKHIHIEVLNVTVSAEEMPNDSMVDVKNVDGPHLLGNFRVEGAYTISEAEIGLEGVVDAT